MNKEHFSAPQRLKTRDRITHLIMVLVYASGHQTELDDRKAAANHKSTKSLIVCNATTHSLNLYWSVSAPLDQEVMGSNPASLNLSFFLYLYLSIVSP